MSLEVVTFGCRLNAYESEVIRAKAVDAGLSDAVILNTCAVTNEAVRQARQAIRRTRRERPGARIIVTGCAAHTDTAGFAAMPEVDQILGQAEKLDAASFAADFGVGDTERVRVNDVMELRETGEHLIDGFGERARAFVQVQNGCDHRCTFCIIPYGRGPSRSVPAGAVVEQIRRLTAAGFNEIVLTGVDLTDYGRDLPGGVRLGDLFRRILKLVPDLPRLRLSSIDSIEADPVLFDVLAHEPRVMGHVHLSLQAGDDMILKRMKRRHSRADAIAFCARLRAARPDIVFGADLIAGFPTETDAMFENSLRLIADCGLTWLHVFPFSPRPGTPAARMPQLPRDVIKARAARLRAAGAAAEARHVAALGGSVRAVLAESETRGRTPCFAPVAFAAPVTPGAIVEARLALTDGVLTGVPCRGAAAA